MFLLTKTKRPKKIKYNIIYTGKRFLKIKTCSAERSESLCINMKEKFKLYFVFFILVINCEKLNE